MIKRTEILTLSPINLENIHIQDYSGGLKIFVWEGRTQTYSSWALGANPKFSSWFRAGTRIFHVCFGSRTKSNGGNRPQINVCRSVSEHNAYGLGFVGISTMHLALLEILEKKKWANKHTVICRTVEGPLICTRIISSNPQPKITKFELCTCALYSNVTIFIKVKEINHLD